MTDWIPLNAKTLAPPKHRTIRGVDITLVMSPYDVPEAVRGEYNKDTHRFIIEFRYINDEPWNLYKHDNHISLRIGRHSRRLYGIEVNVHALAAQRVNLRVDVAKAVASALNKLVLQEEPTQRRENYEVAKDVIEEKQNEIFESLASA